MLDFSRKIVNEISTHFYKLLIKVIFRHSFLGSRIRISTPPYIPHFYDAFHIPPFWSLFFLIGLLLCLALADS